MIIYIGMSRGRPEPFSYVIAHVLNVVGGAAGGFVALKRTTAVSSNPRYLGIVPELGKSSSQSPSIAFTCQPGER
jgi:hypothetical protein